MMHEIFAAIERRDAQRFQALCHPDVEFRWPPSLPQDWVGAWTPLQPTEAERRMDPRVVAADGEEVVVLWHQRAVGAGGARFDGEVLALYRIREGKLARSQMYFFDPEAAARFLADAADGKGAAESAPGA